MKLQAGKLALALMCAGLSWSVSAQADTVPPLWVSNTGNTVLNADDGTAIVNFGFAFPFLGSTYTQGSLSSNGFLWLSGNTDYGCCDGNISDFLSGDPRIAGGWFDLDSSSSGNTRFIALPNEAVITYDQVPECCDTSNLYSFQMQLFSTGQIIFSYESFPNPNGHDILIGVTPGGGAADPGSSDLLFGTPFSTDSGTVYQFIPGACDTSTNTTAATCVDPPFEGADIIFTPNSINGFDVTTDGTPEPASIVLFGLGAAALIVRGARRHCFV